jgi:putative nucleotidyltransferase with HDIG domain
VDVDGYPADPPSPFVAGLCRRVLDDRDTFVCNAPACPDELPPPARDGERFHNLLAAPVVLMDDLNGVVIVGDKLAGDFDDGDVDTVLGVGDQAMVAVRNRHLQRELEGAYLAVVGVLADAVEAKDPYTSGHCELVARYSRLTARRLGLPDPDRAAAFYGGLLHDVGKIGVSDGILNKPGKLLPEEWDLMRSHARIGRDLLTRVPALNRVADVVHHHHESFDGTGYPDGLRGADIGLVARIVCVADAYCAMTSKRSYKESLVRPAARAELLRCRGTQFDPAVVDAFLAVLDEPAEPDPADDGLTDPFAADFRHLLELAMPGGR